MDSGVQIILVQLSPSAANSFSQAGGRRSSSLSGSSREFLKAALENVMESLGPTNTADISYRIHLDCLEQRGLNGMRPLEDVPGAGVVRFAQPPMSGGDVLVLEMGFDGSGAIMNAIA